jgi:hypothetical protein
MDVVSSQAASASTPATLSPAPPTLDPGTAQYAIPSVPPAAAPVSAAPATPEVNGGEPGTSPQGSIEAPTFHDAVSAVFNGSEIDVSFRVAHDPNQVVIVYRNAQTGEVINQIPSEAIIQLAEFFQRESTGALVDQGA